MKQQLQRRVVTLVMNFRDAEMTDFLLPDPDQRFDTYIYYVPTTVGRKPRTQKILTGWKPILRVIRETI